MERAEIFESKIKALEERVRKFDRRLFEMESKFYSTSPLKQSDLPGPFQAEEFGISQAPPCPDPTGEGSAWQGAPMPTEPAPGSDAKHPPIGYRLAKLGEKTKLSNKIAESVVQDLQQACYDRDELRATVERLTAELDTTKRLLAESLVERDRLKNLHDARKVRIDGFRDVLREKLGDLV